MADEITALPGMRRRFLRMDAASIALQLVPLLDRGDREAATTFWFEWRERADRALERKGIGPAVRLALIRSASDEIRREIIAIRGVAALGPVDPAKRPIPARPTAQVVPFRQRVGGAA